MSETEHVSSPRDTSARFPGRAQSPLFLPMLVLAYLGTALAVLSAGFVSIPLRLSELDPAGKSQTLSLIVAVGGIVIILVSAPLGRISDVSTARAGIRRPFILGGAMVGVLGMLVLAFAASVPVIVAGWAVTQAGFGATTMALNALLAEQIPARVRARVAAAFGMSTALAPALGSWLVGAVPGDPRYWFGVPGVLGLLADIGVVVVLRDIVRTEPVAVGWRSLARSYWINPVRHRDFAWAWLCRLLVTMSLVSVATYLLYLLTDRLGLTPAEATTTQGAVIGAMFAASVLTSVAFSWISDRTGRRKPIVYTSALFSGVGLLVAMSAHEPTVFVIGIALVGMGQGAFVCVDVAMMTELLPDSADTGAGAGLAVIALSYQLPQLLLPVLATPLLGLGDSGPNYTALFIGAIVAIVLGGLAALPIKSVR
ncbi:MFS transporter [Nocardia jejuensis]|uniref:MFS transporter n=1 Tax=Nocardia jejuensis TaxID=328049 RepID=UPI00082C71A2|nr:MFS transporter [Nocardia jejuensis]